MASDGRMGFQTPPASPPGRHPRLHLGLSTHGMPRAPAPTSPDGSIHSHRFETSSPTNTTTPPLSSKSFNTLYPLSESSYSPRAHSHFSATSTLISSPIETPSKISSPVPTPSIPPVPKIDRRHTAPRSQSPDSTPALPPERPSSPDQLPATKPADRSFCSPLSRIARKFRAVLSSKQHAGQASEHRPRRLRPPRQEVERVEDVHWTEM